MYAIPLLLAQGSAENAETNAGGASGGPGPLGIDFRGVFSDLVNRLDILNHPEELLTMLGSLNVVVAAILLVVGLLCVLNGYKWHRWVIVICAFLSGIGLGLILSQHMGEQYVIAGAVGLLCAVVATPLLRFTVAAFGGVTGAFIGANAWTALGYVQEAHWAGAAMGFIAMGMASFLMFKHVIVLFTSIGGAALIVFSGITLLINVPACEVAVRNSLVNNHLLLPLLVGVAAVIGLVLQEGQAATDARNEGGDD